MIARVWAWLGRNEWACFAGIGAGILLVSYVERAL
jgi:hypothetical protein